MVAFFIVLLGLSPSLLSIWVMRQADARAQERLRLAMESIANRELPPLNLPPDHQYIEGIGYMIGDLTCEFNARSRHIRCAINPSGPCDGCLHYRSRLLDEV